ncbi:hypothetical protein ACJMK2_039174 [Sinanodonta woodiana]|uniref:Uncharacterized protein n=1 Tax=Sinanodonta woodiana TaxID=1069815 RepID=A0ABD3WD59_SINWO
MPPSDQLDANKKQTADEQKQRIVFPESMPKGNCLAQYIRSIHDNTRGLFPSTAGSKRSYIKYKSVTHLSFTGPYGYNEKEEEEEGMVSNSPIDSGFIYNLVLLYILYIRQHNQYAHI